MGSVDNWVQLLGVLGLGGVITAIITAVANRKMTGASAGAKIIESADTQIENLTVDLTRVRTERDHAHRRANRADTKLRGWWERADRLAPWIRRQEARNAEAGITDPAPPLYPPEDE